MRATLLTVPALVLSLVSPPEGRTAAAGASARKATSIAYEKRVVLGVPIHLITANLNDPRVKVSSVLASGFPGGAESFLGMARRSGAAADLAHA